MEAGAQILVLVQRQAMNYSPPGNQVVFRNDPDRNENVFVHRAFIDDGVFKRSKVPSTEFAQLAAIDCDLIPVVLVMTARTAREFITWLLSNLPLGFSATGTCSRCFHPLIFTAW